MASSQKLFGSSKTQNPIKVNSSETQPPITVKAKVVFLGDPAVGKSAVAKRFVKNEFGKEDPTIGAAYFKKALLINNKIINFDIWDTAGQEIYQALAPLYYRNAAAAIVVYDITESATFNRAKFWVEKLRSEALNNKAPEDIVIALVANKSDLISSSFETKDAQSFAEKNGLLFFEASALTGYNVNKLFSKLGEEVLKVSAQPMIHSTEIDLENPNQQLMQRNSCCK